MKESAAHIFLSLTRWDRPSFFWIFLCYAALYWRKLILSTQFSPARFLLVVLVVAIIQYLLSNGFGRSRLSRHICVGLYLLFFFVFFGKTTIDAVNAWQADELGHQYIRGVVFFAVEFLLIAFFSWAGEPGKVFRAQNIFLTMFFGVALAGSLLQRPLQPRYEKPFIPAPVSFAGDHKEDVPVIFIVLDGYSSAAEVRKLTGDSSWNDFSKALSAGGWRVRDGMYTYETSTIRSLASAFNFNLSERQRLEDISAFQLSEEKLLENVLYDSLTAKGVLVRNFGILDIGKAPPLNRLCFYPKNFFELLFQYTVVQNLLSGDPVRHNKEIITTFPKVLRSTEERRVFYYVHLFMPHAPFHFPPEFPEQDINIDGYLRFRKFTEAKVMRLLQEMLAKNPVRIILTGDHGYREDPRLDSRSTFAAFYGFDDVELDSIRSVQDLGSLLNASF